MSRVLSLGWAETPRRSIDTLFSGVFAYPHFGRSYCRGSTSSGKQGRIIGG
jgi:hypothetical protein